MINAIKGENKRRLFVRSTREKTQGNALGSALPLLKTWHYNLYSVYYTKMERRNSKYLNPTLYWLLVWALLIIELERFMPRRIVPVHGM